MPLIEAALAFAITMLALSLVVSSIVEVIHRTVKLREKGLEYMLGQMFDRVLSNYVGPLVQKNLADPAVMANAPEAAKVGEAAVKFATDAVKVSFVAEMIKNRSPLDSKPDQAKKGWWRLKNLWRDPRVKALSLTDFMSRLGSIDVGAEIKTNAQAAASAAGVDAADAVDLVIKDIARKFDDFGQDAAVYFESRARGMSVMIAIVLAFVVHVDAVDLFRTYLRDPNARAKVIEQAQAVTAQYKASAEAAESLKKLVDANVAPADAKDQFDQLKKAWGDALNNVNTTATQFSNLGAPLGWTPERVSSSGMVPVIWSCLDRKTRESEGFGGLFHKCPDNDPIGYTGATGMQYRDLWFGLPTVASAWLYLFLGGLLIGLGSPFWYDVVTNLTNLRKATQTSAPAPQPAPAPQTGLMLAATTAAPAPQADKPQPVTPVAVFNMSRVARAVGAEAAKPAVAKPTAATAVTTPSEPSS